MASRTRVVVNRQAIRDILRSPEVEAELVRRAKNIAAAADAGEQSLHHTAEKGHRVDSEIGPSRARAAVITDTIGAIVSEATHRTLTRAFDAGRR